MNVFTKKGILALCLGVFIIPFILNVSISIYPWGITDNKTWLGAIFAGTITLIGIQLTLKDNRKHYEEIKEEEEKNRQLNLQHYREIKQREEENRRLSLQPFLNVYVPEDKIDAQKYYTYDFRDSENVENKYLYNTVRFNLGIKNIGMSLASNIYVMSLEIIGNSEGRPLEDLKHLTIAKDSSAKINIFIWFNEGVDIGMKDFILDIHFSDILKNRYKQKIKIFYEHNGYGDAGDRIRVTAISNPELL